MTHSSRLCAARFSHSKPFCNSSTESKSSSLVNSYLFYSLLVLSISILILVVA